MAVEIIQSAIIKHVHNAEFGIITPLSENALLVRFSSTKKLAVFAFTFFLSHCNAAIALFETNKCGCDFATQQCQNTSKHGLRGLDAKMLQIETFRDLILPNTAVSAEFGVGIPGNPTHSGCGWPRPRQGSGRRIIV